ncbi:hypothetical protein H0A66_15165 [Alcaligenaceae bacterium]|nr:hypothetical protein [Alcaligenaceae bacterium]
MWLWSLGFRAGLSLLLAVLPAYAIFFLLRVAGGAFDVDLIGGTIDTLINTHLPWLTSVSDLIKEHPDWAPLLSIWAAVAFTVFKTWSSRIEFFVVSGQDESVLHPRPGLSGHDGIVPWIEASEQSIEPGFQLTELRSFKTWKDQHVATKTLLAWIHQGSGDGRWGWLWPRQPTANNTPSWQPLKLALLTGANGVGKSSLVAALGDRLATGRSDGWGAMGLDHDVKVRLQRLQAAVGAWIRNMLPWLRRQTNDPWDVGVLKYGDDLPLAALSTWEPRRPTLFIVDEPNGRVSQALRILGSRRNAFWHPVRVLMIDQSFPLALDAYVPSPAAAECSAIPLEYCEELRLGEVRFDVDAIRTLWYALCTEQSKLQAHRLLSDKDKKRDKSGADQPASDKDDKRDVTFVGNKPLHKNEMLMLLRVIGPNPLHLALALAQLMGKQQSVYEMCNTAIGGQALAAQNQEDQLQKLAYLDASHVNHRMIERRAEDLVLTYEDILRQQAPSLEHEVMLSIAAATVTGGLALPRELSVRLNVSVLRQLFPGTVFPGFDLDVRIPPVRPTVIARTFLEKWIGARAAPQALAADVAAFAWQHNPEGALHALHEGSHLPDMLRHVLADVAGDQAQRLPWAQGCCAAMLCNNAGVEPFVAALNGLMAEELLELDRWLGGRLALQHPRRPEPLRVLIALSQITVRLAAGITGEQLAVDIDARVKTFVHWADLAGATERHRLSRRRELATAVVILMQSITGADDIGTEAKYQFIDELLIACRDKGSETNRAACRHLIRYARSIDGAISNRIGGAADHTQALAQAYAWLSACRAASQVGGERALTITQTLAGRVEAVVTAQPDFVGHAGLQEVRATAWVYVSYAASQLGGERALELAQALAGRVDAIVTAQLDFAAHAGLQKLRATAWCYATSVASELGGERALELARALAGRVEAIAMGHPDFAVHARLQEQCAMAWCYMTFAASQLGGERALELAQALAGRVEAIVTAQPEFATHAALQESRSSAWCYVSYAASQLGGERALELAQALAARVEVIVMAQPDYAGDVGLQEKRAMAWYHAAYVASQLGGERALGLVQVLAARVEAIVTAQPDFAAHARLQESCATAWRFATYAASRLGGELALELAQALAGRVVATVTAQPDFAAHAALQKECAIVWCYVNYAASQLGGERALELAQVLAGRVEAIVTAQPDFAGDVELQEVLDLPRFHVQQLMLL